ncbi:acyclic terpene utilization AtuA family protein [Streptomyces celluloflavus]|uniref:acyclic terpene utilization AtuA family protein n=1 Tax=Streptomyces celluloflavus TaxID=58344 RepID=UPI0036D09108
MSTPRPDAPAPEGSPPGAARPAVLRIGNASGFYGDRFGAVREMLTGGPLDVLTGDYLAELTMLILGRDRQRHPDRGYARTFLRQLEENLGLAVDRGVRIVTNAGGLNPAGLADAIRELAAKAGVPVRVAHVEGDDLLARRGASAKGGLGAPAGPGWSGDPGQVAALGRTVDGWGPEVLTANAYLGGGGIAACLRAGAQVVVTGRVTDAALVSGAAAAHFGWRPQDLDQLAGAVVAGHVLECGTQATGGNYAFFGAHDVRRPGFPLAEIAADGSSVITKHPGTGGAVTPGTVTAQLLYETAGARYAGPDVTARLDTVRLTADGADRVRIEGVRGEAPPPSLKAGLTRLGGWRNEVTFVLTGLDIDAKAELVRAQMAAAFDAAGRRPAEVRWTLARTDHADAAVQEEASALLRLVVRDADPAAVGRVVSGAAVELALGSYPGFHVTAPPGKGDPYGVFEAVAVDRAAVPHLAVLPDGTRVYVQHPVETRELTRLPDPPLPPPLDPGLPVRRAPLGRVAGARSGDKGGSANVGVWVGTDQAWRWLVHELTVERFRQLLPETAGLPVDRHVLPRLRALNFMVDGLLGEGVAAQARFDPQAKAVGEWLRSRYLEIPEVLL